MTASITASIPRGAHVERTDLRAISFHHVRFVGPEMVDVEITGEIEDVTINGVDIDPLIEAELNRRMPDRAKMRRAPRSRRRPRSPSAGATCRRSPGLRTAPSPE